MAQYCLARKAVFQIDRKVNGDRNRPKLSRNKKTVKDMSVGPRSAAATLEGVLVMF